MLALVRGAARPLPAPASTPLMTRDPASLWKIGLIVSLLLFVVGMFIESNAAYIMLVPLLHPIAIKFGIDPLHFGFLFVFNLVIGMLTPPVGVVLFGFGFMAELIATLRAEVEDLRRRGRGV